jgi:hypothetical protein
MNEPPYPVDPAVRVEALQRALEAYAVRFKEQAARIKALEAALRFLLDTKWKSVDKDNMEFEGRVTCYQLDKARAALAPEQDK